MEADTDILVGIGWVAQRLGISQSTVRRLEAQEDGWIPRALRWNETGPRRWRQGDIDAIAGWRQREQGSENAGDAHFPQALTATKAGG